MPFHWVVGHSYKYFDVGGYQISGPHSLIGGLRLSFNMKAGTADLPGDGTSRLTSTRTQDIGHFVAAVLNLEKWETQMGMVGSTMSYHEVVGAIEKVTRRKMLVKHNTVE